jgi:hypothetical protein
VDHRLTKLLHHLVERLDVERLEEAEQRALQALRWEPLDRLPLVICVSDPPVGEFQPFPVAEVFGDPEKMLFNELVHAFGTSVARWGELGDDLPCTVRANFGTVVIASMYGAPVRQVGDNPPWIVHHEDHPISLDAVLDQDSEDLSRGWAPHVIETMEKYREILDEFPSLAALVRVVLPDLQGPFDNLELITGSDLYADLVDAEERVDAALAAMARTQIAMAKRLASLVSDGPEGFSHQHAVPIRGNILLRDDSVLMMSPRMYREQVAPHDEAVLAALGGGGIHCCGNLGRHAAAFLEVPSIRSLDLGQPELNDMDSIYTMAREKKVPLIRVTVSEEELTSGRVLNRYPTGVVLCHRVKSWDEGNRVLDGYLRASMQR